MIYFRAPDPGRFVSGGNIYNHHLVSSFRSLGHEVQFQDSLFGPTEKQDLILWDSLFLSALLDASLATVGQSILIVHSDSPAFYHHLPKLVNSSLRFILPGQYMVDVLRERGVSSDRCLLLEPGMDEPFPESNSSAQLPVRLIVIANLTPDKGILDFLQALHTMTKINPDVVQLHVYGDDQIDPGCAAQCNRLIASDNMNKWVTGHGILAHARLMSLLGEYHALLSVSPKETFGMAIREARMAGIPVLGIQGGNIPNLIQQDVDGLLFSTREELVAFIQKQLTEPMGFLQSLRAFHPRKVSPHSWQEQARKLLSWL